MDNDNTVHIRNYLKKRNNSQRQGKEIKHENEEIYTTRKKMSKAIRKLVESTNDHQKSLSGTKRALNIDNRQIMVLSHETLGLPEKKIIHLATNFYSELYKAAEVLLEGIFHV